MINGTYSDLFIDDISFKIVRVNLNHCKILKTRQIQCLTENSLSIYIYFDRRHVYTADDTLEQSGRLCPITVRLSRRCLLDWVLDLARPDQHGYATQRWQLEPCVAFGGKHESDWRVSARIRRVHADDRDNSKGEEHKSSAVDAEIVSLAELVRARKDHSSNRVVQKRKE